MPTPTEKIECQIAILHTWRKLTTLIEDPNLPDFYRRALKEIRDEDLETALEALD